MTKIQFQGREVEATEVDFFTQKEDFNVYQLTDGTLLKMKTVVTSILRVEGEKDPKGNQIYHVQSTNIARVRK